MTPTTPQFTPAQSTLQELSDRLHATGCSCVIRHGDQTHLFQERGIKDLYRLLHESPEWLRGASVADKVVGKGAAALLILGGVRELAADLLSESAYTLLTQAQVEVVYGQCVPHIINRTQTGWCPIEALCRDCTTAAECLPLIEKFITNQK